jgi:hypothetical protein
LHDAFERFGDPAHLSFRTQASDTFEELFQEQKAVVLPLDHEEHKVMTEQLNDAQHRIHYYQMLLGDDLRERLLRGELIARAYREPHVHGALEVTISRHEWRILRPTLPDRAEGAGIGYVGVMIGKPGTKRLFRRRW